ncbi:MAG: SusC/RagA family TonB-linked outer membrane protein [Rikenellaceae bacterium]|jgi:TonB-linked SusC/RagA family outer membrane protein|nr:SusC/RagA family TonB-linked outer membrane protein [Rikenellaceae bacterium]
MRKIVLSVLSVLFLVATAFGQSRQVTGTVTSPEGSPAAGTTVTVKGTTTGTITDNSGKYSISAPDNGVLVFSFIGMESQEVPVAGKSVINVQMAGSAETIDDVLVVAYGTVKKEAFTGSAGVIDASQLSMRQTSNVTKSIAGQVAGVVATTSTGQPGTSATIRIRGVGSMGSSNEPLYVVDGVPFEGNKSAINPNDIAAISVLKDAAASAIYGARGANGVIVITTKKGKTAEAVITIDAKIGINRRGVPNYDVMTDPGMYYETFYKALYNSQIYADSPATSAVAHTFARGRIEANNGLGYRVYDYPAGQYLINEDFKLNPNATLGYNDGTNYFIPDNWYDELFDKGNMRQEYNVTVSGASEKVNYFFSAGFLDDTGLIPNSGFERWNARSKVDYQAKKWLKVGANMGYTYYDSQYPSGQTTWGSTGNRFYAANMVAPIYPLYIRNAAGNIVIDNYGNQTYDYGKAGSHTRPFLQNANPLGDAVLDSNHDYTDMVDGKFYADINLYKGLSFLTNIGVMAENNRSNAMQNPYYGNAAARQGRVYLEQHRTFSVNQQYLLTYKYNSECHNLDVLAGYESYAAKYYDFTADNYTMYNPDVAELGNTVGTPPNVDSGVDKYATYGFLGRVQYDYRGKYFVSASYRRDASSRFHPDNRWGDFGGVGLAWLINKEGFFEGLDTKWVDMVKLKGSFGVQGNDDLMYDASAYSNYYPYLDQYELNMSRGDFAPTLYYKGNKDITWETSYNTNVGLEFSLFNSRLSGSVEYYTRKTVDLLTYVPVPPSLGYSSFPDNIGSIRNSGFEFDLSGTIMSTEKMQLTAYANLTTQKNEILDLVQDRIERSTRLYTIGGSLYDAFLPQYAGVNESGQATWYTDPTNGDMTPTTDWSAAKQVNLGSTLPKIYGGFGLGFAFYGFDVSVSCAYQLGGKAYDSGYQELMHTGDSRGTNFHKDILKSWSADNTGSSIPRLNTADVSAQRLSDRFIISSDYLSIDNINFGYTIPAKLLGKVGISKLRIYGVVDNVHLFSKRQGLDPRQLMGAVSGIQSTGAFRYSPIRSFSGGVSLSF